jgi:hypothetical protein
MNFNYYREFNPELKNMSNNELKNYFYYNSKKKIKIFNEETFYYLYPDFDYLLYSTINKDLSGYSKFKLQQHYHLYGKNEQRIYSKKKFYECYPNFVLDNNDLNNILEEYEILAKYHNNNVKLEKKNNNNNYMDINYYKEFNKDLKGFREDYLIKYFSKYGDRERRIYNEEIFYQFYPDFDYDFYKNMDNELYNYNKFDTQVHYHNIGLSQNRVISLKSFYERFPKFDIEFYKNFNDELIDKCDEMIIYKHYYKIGSIENRICYLDNFNGTYNNFIELFNSEYSDFDIYFYGNYYEDLLLFKNKLKLMHHYYFIGKNENRYISENDFNNRNPDFINNFKINYPDFDTEYFKNFYKLYDLTDILLMIYYERYKNTKYRIYNNESYLRLINEFDYIFYKNYYEDLKNYNTKEELLEHYNNIGIVENRLINEYYFNKIYPEFDINFYKNFNNFELRNILSFHKHFLNIGLETNKKYFEYDFEINNYYENQKTNINRDWNVVRHFNNYNSLYDYHTKYDKKYFIYNKDSFLKYYSNFDLTYYRNNYFKNSNKTDYEILLYYHNIGKYNNHSINNKLQIIIYTPMLNINNGGIIALHNLARLINELHNPNIYVKLFTLENARYKNIFCNDFANIYDVNDNTLVIYPEFISGNPLNSKNVVRWILLDLGIEMPFNHYEKWDKKDLIYFWETKDTTNKYFKQLNCQWLNNIFYNKGLKFEERNNTCYIIKKSIFVHKNIKYLHKSDSICLDNIHSLKEKCDIFNKCKYFYCYDPNTMYIIYALLCGCIPIIYPLEGISKTEYMKNRISNCGNELIDIGFAYGNSEIEINNCIEKNINAKFQIDKIFDFYKNQVNIFCDEIYSNIFNNKKLDNTIENYYL